MRIAIFGATSEIAKDLILAFADHIKYEITLFARRPEVVKPWLSAREISSRYSTKHFDEFNSQQEFDAILNFVGVGSPAQATQIGSGILDVTHKFDTMVLEYLQKYPDCRYLFMSSGAVYGSNFEDPVDHNSYSLLPINHLKNQDWYGLSKLYAEARHRSTSFSIVDIRIFNYFSHTQNLETNFFITEVIKSIMNKKILITSPENIIRDYLGSHDFFSLIRIILEAPKFNGALDCYSLAPVNKWDILEKFKKLFGLEYELATREGYAQGTGFKKNYYSNWRSAESYGYIPTFSSLDLLIQEAKLIIQTH